MLAFACISVIFQSVVCMLPSPQRNFLNLFQHALQANNLSEHAYFPTFANKNAGTLVHAHIAIAAVAADNELVVPYLLRHAQDPYADFHQAVLSKSLQKLKKPSPQEKDSIGKRWEYSNFGVGLLGYALTTVMSPLKFIVR